MRKSSERGSGRVQFLIVMTVIVATAYAGYLYVPVSFRAHAYKDLMQHYADVAATQGYQPSWAGEQLLKSWVEYDVPPRDRKSVVWGTGRDPRGRRTRLQGGWSSDVCSSDLVPDCDDRYRGDGVRRISLRARVVSRPRLQRPDAALCRRCGDAGVSAFVGRRTTAKEFG